MVSVLIFYLFLWVMNYTRKFKVTETLPHNLLLFMVFITATEKKTITFTILEKEDDFLSGCEIVGIFW